MYNRKAFKQEAKQLMRASVPHFMLVALVYVLLTTGLSYVVSWLTGGSGPLAGVLSVFLNILVWLFGIVMAVGFANYALRLSRREETGMGSLFAAFSFSGRSIGVQLLSALFIFLWSMLAIVVFAVVIGVLFALTESIPLLAIVTVILYIALIVVVVAIALRYAMAPFALVDDPDAGVMEAIRRSIRMMRGYKGKYFVLELSFIGWELLIGVIVSVVMGIGFTVGGTSWFLEAMETVESNPWTMYGMMETLMDQMFLWSLLAEVISLPLTLWLAVYRQTAAARFYNYVGGYDYHQYMNGGQTPDQGAPLTPPAREPQQPPQPPTGGYDTPQSPAPEEPSEKTEQTEQPKTPPSRGGYYNSVLPPETPGEDPEETPDESDEEEEI